MKSPVRENRPPGSVRGAPGNRRPYRDPIFGEPIRLRTILDWIASAQVRFSIRVFLLLTFLLSKAGAFSLLGPYASWMDQEKSYQLPADIGGPMKGFK